MMEVSQTAKTLDEKRSDSLKFLEQVQSQRKVRSTFTIKREMFDPTKKEHLKSYYEFLETGKWGSVQFLVEHPFENAVDTVVYRFAKFALEEKLNGA